MATRDPTTAPVVPTPRPTDGPTRATRDPTAAPITPTVRGQFNAEEDNNNEALYLALFLVFGILFCCLCLGILYYFYRKNSKQSEEVRRNNDGHVVIAGNSSASSPDHDENEEADVAIAHAMLAEGANTTAVDASDGYRSTAGQVTTAGNTAGSPLSASVSPGPGADADAGLGELQPMSAEVDQDGIPDLAGSARSGRGIDGLSDEDDEKSDIYRVNM